MIEIESNKTSKKEMGKYEITDGEVVNWISNSWIEMMYIIENIPKKMPVIPCNDKLWIFL